MYLVNNIVQIDQHLNVFKSELFLILRNGGSFKEVKVQIRHKGHQPSRLPLPQKQLLLAALF
jgi:hypothetical protein